ncbi:MAG TPA: HAD-IIA family hydrolase [Chloroflexia bacterium]|nr:HAD-IIA family hydrolase [Chloroflexia bacterium]
MGELEGKFSGLILDMDGVLYRGDQALPGAQRLFPALRAAGIEFLLLTNNATLTSAEFSEKLARMGIAVRPEAILTSAGATALYMKEHFPEGGGVNVIGSSSLLSTVTSDPAFHPDGWQPNFVVVGLDLRFNYDALQRACSAIRRGAHFIATNADATLPVEGGEQWPGAGSIVAAVQTCSGVAPLVIGKPEPHMARMALDLLDLPPDQVLCVGDRLETDILLGARAGIPTALLLSGVSRREDIERFEVAPDCVYEDLPALMSALGIG